jgi:Tfp pilus assembly protein PilN
VSEELAESTPPERTEFRPSILRRIVRWCVNALVGALVGILVMSLIQVLLVATMSTEIEVDAVLLSTSAFFLSGAFLVLMVLCGYQ